MNISRDPHVPYNVRKLYKSYTRYMFYYEIT